MSVCVELILRVRPCQHSARGIWKRRFQSENASNIFRPHYTGGIWKRSNASNIFCLLSAREEFETEVSIWKRIKYFSSTLRQRNLKRHHLPLIWIFVWRKLGQEIILKKGTLSSFSGCVRAFSESSFSCRISVDGRPDQVRPNHINKVTFSNSFGVE